MSRNVTITSVVVAAVALGMAGPAVPPLGIAPALAAPATTGGGEQVSTGRVRMRDLADDYQRVNTMFGVMEAKNADTSARIEEAARRMAELPDPAAAATPDERLAAEAAALKEAAVFIRAVVEFYDTNLSIGQDAYAVLQGAMAKIEAGGGAGAPIEAKALFHRSAEYFEKLKETLARVHGALAKNPGDRQLRKSFKDLKSRLDTLNSRLAHMQTVSRQGGDGATYATALHMVGDSLGDLRGSIAAFQGEREYALYLKELLEAKATGLMGAYFGETVRKYNVAGLGGGGAIGQGIGWIEKVIFRDPLTAFAEPGAASGSSAVPELPKYPTYPTR